MQDEILKNFDQHIFYHGTSYYGAENIYNKRFYTAPGLLGGGVYITSNWLIAIWAIHYHGFWRDEDGRAILQINISKGTRILNSAIEPDRKCLQYLRKEFGKDILKKHPRKVIPKNKRLTQREFINLFRYHYWEAHEKNKRRFDNLPHSFWYYLRQSVGAGKRAGLHGKLFFDLLTDLRVQYQFDGFGNPEDDLGIVIFEGKHLEVKEFVFEYNMKYWIRSFYADVGQVNRLDKEMKKIFSELEASWQNNPDGDFQDNEWFNPKSNLRKKFPDVDHLRKYFQKHGSKEAKELAKQVASAAKKKS